MADKRVVLKSMKKINTIIIPGKNVESSTPSDFGVSSSSHRRQQSVVDETRECDDDDGLRIVGGVGALPSLAFGISSEAKADLAASRDAKKAAILAAARAKAEGQAANVVSSSQEQDGAEEATTTKASTTAFQPASFIDASKSGAGVRGGGPGAGNTYEVTKQATPAPAPPTLRRR